jgi:MOSC domain-containing protein YiiM
MQSSSGRVVRLFLREEKRVPVTEVTSAEARRGSGFVGDHKKGGKRQITVLSAEGWSAACAEIGASVDASLRRANVLVEGLDLRQSIGQFLRLGDLEIEVLGETDPCERMDEAQAGLMQALVPHLRGGVFGRVTQAGQVRVDDLASLHTESQG